MKIVALVSNKFKKRDKWLPFKIQARIHALKFLTLTVLRTSRFYSIDDKEDNQLKEITVLSMKVIERVKAHVQTISKSMHQNFLTLIPQLSMRQ